MSAHTSARALIAAALLFWVSWLLMPGVGVTDPAQIFALVSASRPAVLASVVLQLASAVLYVPALLGLAVRTDLPGIPVHGAGGLLLVGAIGSAADAVLHLLAFAMTAPGVDMQAMQPAMAFMQGPGLWLLAPLLLAFFVGSGRLSHVLARAGLLARANLYLHWAALAIAMVGGRLAAHDLVPARAVGLTALAIVSGAQIWAGLALLRARALNND